MQTLRQQDCPHSYLGQAAEVLGMQDKLTVGQAKKRDRLVVRQRRPESGQVNRPARGQAEEASEWASR
jgi:hypothetical protein